MPSPILVTGAGGMLGWELARALNYASGSPRVITTGHGELDIADKNAVESCLGRERPAVVINAAAYTNVDGAETEREAARRANALGPAVLARACRERGVKLVHFGTDQVFDGSGEKPWNEEDPARPCNHYAATKHEGELAVLKNADALCLRVQWLYGEKKNRFAILRDREVFRPFVDQWGAPTWAKDVAETVTSLLRRGAAGLFHYSYDDYASWAEIYAFVKEIWGLEVKLEPVQTAEARLAAKRPRFSVMANGKLARFLGVPGLGSWKEPMRRFLAAEELKPSSKS